MYATVDAMLKKFGERELIQLTDTVAPYQKVINSEKLDAALAEANSEIDGYLASRYQLPLSAVPPFLEAIACNMARYHACTGAISENNPIAIKYQNAIKSLKEIAKGTVAIGGTPAGDAAPVQTSSNNVMYHVGRHDWGGKGW